MDVKFGVEPGNGKRFFEDIKKRNQFGFITRASISHCFPKNGVGEKAKKWVEKKNCKKRGKR